jgi:DNA invertase Pin-like site-specific DNA recombinase
LPAARNGKGGTDARNDQQKFGKSGGRALLIGYFNLPLDQISVGLSEPQNALIAHGVSRLFIDIDTGNGLVPQLQLALAELGAGDALVSPTIQTVTRSVAGLLDLHAQLQARGASLQILHLGGGIRLDTATVEGRAILGALAVVSGLLPNMPVAASPTVTAAASLASMSRPRGRPVTAGNQADEINRLRAEGVRAIDIAACLGIGRASVYRILSQGQGAGEAEEPVKVAPVGIKMMAGRFDPFNGR